MTAKRVRSHLEPEKGSSRLTLGDVRGLIGATDGALGGDSKLEPAQADSTERQRGLHGCGEKKKRGERPKQHLAGKGREGRKEEEEGGDEREE